MYFSKRLSFRIRSDEIKQVKQILKSNRYKYFNESHFIRCAVLKLINEEKNEAKK